MKLGNRYPQLLFCFLWPGSSLPGQVSVKSYRGYLILFFCELCFFFTSPIRAQNCSITFDATNSTSTNAQNISLPITVSGSDRLLVAEVNVFANDSTSTINSVTYGGAPMSQVIQTTRTGAGGNRQGIFVLTAPATGNNNLAVNLGGTENATVGVIDYNGVDQVNPVGAVTNVFNALALSQSVVLTPTQSNSQVVANLMWYSNLTLISSLGTGQTQRWSQVQNDSTEGDDQSSGSASSITMQYLLVLPAQADIQAIEILHCTPTPTQTSTATATNSATNTATGTATSTGTNTNTSLNTSTQTATYTATNTSTDTATATSTNTPIPTATSTATSTATNTPVPNTATSTSTPLPTATATNTATVTMTLTITLTPTITPIPTVTANPYPVYSAYPNPFTPDLPTNNTALFNLPANHGAGAVVILTLRQRPVRHLAFSPGATVGWDGRDDSGNLVHSGLYVFVLSVDGHISKRSLTLLR